MSFDIQAVFFDLGDTVIRIKLEISEKISLSIGNNRGKPLATIEYLTAFQDEWNKRQMPLDKELIKSVVGPKGEIRYWNNFFASLLPALGVVSDKERLATTLAKIYSDADSFECFDDVHGVLAELKAKNLKLGVISNAFPSAKSIINRLDLKQYFDHILLSYDIEYIKPEPQIYRFAVETLNVDIDKSIFVDDRWAFVKAALDLGMDAYLIDRISPLKKALKTRSLVPRISSLVELRDKILGNDQRPEHTPSPKKAEMGIDLISSSNKRDVLVSAQ